MLNSLQEKSSHSTTKSELDQKQSELAGEKSGHQTTKGQPHDMFSRFLHLQFFFHEIFFAPFLHKVEVFTLSKEKLLSRLYWGAQISMEIS